MLLAALDIPPGDAVVIAAALPLLVLGFRTNHHAKRTQKATETGNGATLAQKVEELTRWAARKEGLDNARHEQNLQRIAFLARRQRQIDKHVTELERSINGHGKSH